jgi:hypothetical protein
VNDLLRVHQAGVNVDMRCAYAVTGIFQMHVEQLKIARVVGTLA